MHIMFIAVVRYDHQMIVSWKYFYITKVNILNVYLFETLKKFISKILFEIY